MISKEAMAIMEERFGHDNVIALATVSPTGAPAVRYVDALFIEDSFYVVTYALSGKMQQMTADPRFSVCGEWFTAEGKGENLGWVKKPENAELMEKLRTAFSAWYDNGHTNEEDPNTILLRLRLHTGVLMSHGTRLDLLFGGGI